MIRKMKYNIPMANSRMKSLQVAEAAGMKGLLNPSTNKYSLNIS